MREFVNLDEQDIDLTPTKVQVKLVEDIETPMQTLKLNKIIDDSYELPDITIKEILTPEVEEDPLCVKDCDNSVYYGCPTEDDGFKVSNLFSELTTEYQRALARLNLGIGDEFTNEWGNIKGNILKQKDLVNLLYTQLKFKADVTSPVFSGIPCAPKPSIADDSNQIATTSWVMEQLKNYEGGGGGGTSSVLTSFTVTPSFAYKEDGPQNLKLSWAFRKEIKSQKLNDAVLDKDVRSFETTVSEDTVFKLEYEYEDSVEYKTINFSYKYARYFGTSDNYLELSRTTGNKFNITCGPEEYAYILLPNNANARLAVNGFVGGFKMIRSVTLHETNYYTYQSTHKGLGNINIELLD